MSTKRAAVLLTKDRCLLSSKGIQDGQYNSINLNHHKKCDGNVKLFQCEIISKDSPKSNGYVAYNDYNSSSGRNISHSLKENDISKSLGNLCIQGGNQEKEEIKWQNKSDMSNSTLSLHIAAYENGIENQNVDHFSGKGFEQETFASETLKNAFDFPRQFQEFMKPDMMQFKTSQKLMNFKAMAMFPTTPLMRSVYPKKFYYSEVVPLCLKNEVDVRRQKVPGGSCTQELQALFGCLKKWEFDDLPCAKLHTEYMRCVETAEKAANAFKEGAKKGILGEGTSKLSTAQFNKIMAMFPQPDLGVSQRKMKRLPHMSYADDLYRRKDKNKPN